MTILLKKRLIDLSTPKVMGILNLTPDSFYDGGRLKFDSQILKLAEKHLKDGAFALDLGGYSSRPGADHISEEYELGRVLPVVELLTKEFPEAPLSKLHLSGHALRLQRRLPERHRWRRYVRRT